MRRGIIKCMKIFCKKCGFCNNYNLTAPGQCSKCNFEFKNNIFINNATNNNQETTVETTVSDYDKNVSFKNVKPAFKVTVYQTKSSTLSNLINQIPSSFDKENTLQKKNHDALGGKKTSEQILAEFQQEGGSLR